MKWLSIGLFILFLSTSLSLVNAAAAATATLTIDTSPRAAAGAEDVCGDEVQNRYANFFFHHYLSLGKKAVDESERYFHEQCRKNDEAREHHLVLMRKCMENVEKGIPAVVPVEPVLKTPQIVIFQINGIEARQAFKEILPVELRNNPEFLRKFRTTIAITFQALRGQGKGTLRYARFLINAINDQLKRLEGGLSPRSVSDESEYSLFAPSLSKLSRVDGKDYLRDDLFDDSAATAGAGAEAAVVRATVLPGPLTDIQVDPLVLNQHEEPDYDSKCAYFALFNALCYVNECEGYLVPDLRQDNFAKFKMLYLLWKSIADEIGSAGDEGLNIQQQVKIYNRIIAGAGGIENAALREAFKKHVVFFNRITLERFDKEPLTQTYIRFRSKTQTGENIANKNIAAVVEAFRAGRLHYLIAIHGTIGDMKWNFAKQATSGHASAVLYKRLSDNSTFAMIADTDIGTYPRTMIKHLYLEVLSNQSLPREEIALAGLLERVQRWSAHYQKCDYDELTYKHEITNKWSFFAADYIEFRRQKLDEIRARLAAVASLIKSDALAKHFENSFKLLSKLYVEAALYGNSRVEVIIDYIVGIEQFLSVVEEFHKSWNGDVADKASELEMLRGINEQIGKTMLLYKKQFEQFKEVINEELESVEAIDDELKGYVEQMNSDLIDYTLELKAPERGIEVSGAAAGAAAAGAGVAE